MRPSSLLVVSLGFSVYSIMSSANNGSLTFFPIWIPFIFFSSLIDVASISKTMLNRSGLIGHFNLVPDLKIKWRTRWFHRQIPPDDSDSKASTCNAGDLGLIPRLRRSPGEGNGNTLQYSCLENSVDGGAG